jgi:Holliday junction DNA helicase RuvB
VAARDPIVNQGAFAPITRGSRDTPPGTALPCNPSSALDPARQAPDQELEGSLRPRTLDEFIGQTRVVENLRVALQAARGRDEALEHVLLAGPPGLGKTSLARILGGELGTRLHATSGPALERPRDLVGILTQLQQRDVLFVDEVHRIPAAVEEFLYSAMEDFKVDFTLDQGPHARILPLSLAPFTLVGATTREGLLSAPFRARFGLVERLLPYPASDLVRILSRSARLLDVELSSEASALVAVRSRGTPRVANRFLRRIRDAAQLQGTRVLDADLAARALANLGVDEHGLEDLDRRILACLARGQGEPVGLKTIAAAVGESEDTIEEVFEPHLLRSGLVQKTARGRQLTQRGLALLKSAPSTLFG